MHNKPVRLSIVRDERTRSEAKAIRRGMFDHVRGMVTDAGDKIAGFSVVIWDAEGYNWSTLRGGGPIKSRMVPSFTHDALQQHVTIDLGKRER